MNACAARIEQALVALLEARREEATLCPSEVARAAGGNDWRAALAEVRAVSWRLADAGCLCITQTGRAVAPGRVRGPVRIGRGRNFARLRAAVGARRRRVD